MSQDNVEIIKAAIDAFNRQDWDAVFKDAAPGAELDFSRAVGPFSGVFKLDQLRRPFFEDFASDRSRGPRPITAGVASRSTPPP
jgi:hypothetical protein